MLGALLQPDVIFSCLSAIAAIISAWIGWQLLKRQRDDDTPRVSSHLVVAPSETRLLVLQFCVVHQGPIDWKATRFSLKTPNFLVAMPSDVQPSGFMSAGQVSVDCFLKNASPLGVDLNVIIPAFRSGASLETGTKFVLYLSPDRYSTDRKVYFGLTLVSMDAVQRRIEIDMSRALPDDLKRAKSM